MQELQVGTSGNANNRIINNYGMLIVKNRFCGFNRIILYQKSRYALEILVPGRGASSISLVEL